VSPDRSDFGNCLAQRLGPYEALEIVHAMAHQFAAARVDQRLPTGRAGLVERVAIEIQDVAHLKFQFTAAKPMRITCARGCNNSNAS
jgi:hypothetical protein